MVARWSRALRNPGSCGRNSPLANFSAVPKCAGAIGLRGLKTSTSTYTAATVSGSAVDPQARKKQNEQSNTVLDPFHGTAYALEKLSYLKPSVEEHWTNRREAVDIASEDIDWEAVSGVIGMELDEDPVLDQQQHQTQSDKVDIPEVLWELLSSDARFGGPSLLDWPSSTGIDPGKKYNLPPQSLWALEMTRLKAMRNRQTRKKLAIQELSICLMIYRLLAGSKAHKASDDALDPLLPHIRNVALLTPDEMGRSIRRIRANISALETTPDEDWPEDPMTLRTGLKFDAEPSYVQDEDGDFHLIASQLNAAIKNLFIEHQSERDSPESMALATAKLCHNLIVSTAAPNLQTFNVLLTGFQKWECPALIDFVIQALDDCKIRPNEITCAAILEHYTETQRPDEFSRFVAKMRGAGDALMLARPDININEASQGRLVRTSEKKVYQKVHPTPLVFDAMMHGVLKFAGFDRAMDIYYDMKADGWGLDVRGLSRLLDDCMHRADWTGGLAVWEEIASIKGRIRPGPLSKAYAQFLTLCSVAQKPAAFNTVLGDVVKRGFNRKAVLKEVRAYTQAVRRGRGYLAPAWTADNLLIAVSGGMKGDGDSEAAEFFQELNVGEEVEVKAELKAELKAGSEEVKGSSGGSSGAQASPGTQESSDTQQNPDAWNAWLEHELGDAKGGKSQDK